MVLGACLPTLWRHITEYGAEKRRAHQNYDGQLDSIHMAIQRIDDRTANIMDVFAANWEVLGEYQDQADIMRVEIEQSINGAYEALRDTILNNPPQHVTTFMDVSDLDEVEDEE
jgi:hypothetical protein